MTNPPAVDNLAARTRLARLPQPRHALQQPVILALVTLALGFTIKWLPQFRNAEFQIDQFFSRHHSPALNAIAVTIQVLLSARGILIILIITFLFLLLVRRSPVNAFAVVSVAGIGWLSSEAFKIVVAQPRPNQALLQNPLIPNDGTGSFPSGHTTFAVAFAIAYYFLARQTRWSKVALACGILFVTVVGLSRVYLGVHYPSDIIGSVLVAATTTSLVTVIWNRYALSVLARIPFLDRFGPLPQPPARPGKVRQ
ncbi:phosphatase PAP2 family protein [Cryobacterium algoritolerans]|uniref:Phosphatase PAP2 family protein n=1 Tax=Cryobacterium algoritolerans TaxID=1259184 RepID=A0A4R8WS71_9MICO|nr:phosphatase PAP2 family protein [Cryobacterium algoritolerans]TFC15196.1 phosphatase PAP2 family protein [Cryobacterium algoritolerans]